MTQPTLIPGGNGEARRPTLPPSTGPPDPAASWPGVARAGIEHGGAIIQRHQEARERAGYSREPRPPASTLSIANAVAIGFTVVVIIVLVVLHQQAANGYEQRQSARHESLLREQQERHNALMREMEAQRQRHEQTMAELAQQRTALYELIDNVAAHHPEAERVGKRLERGTVRR